MLIQIQTWTGLNPRVRRSDLSHLKIHNPPTVVTL